MRDMDWLDSDVATLAAALGSSAPSHPMLHSPEHMERLREAAGRLAGGSASDRSASMLPTLSALVASQLTGRRGHFAVRRWNILLEPSC